MGIDLFLADAGRLNQGLGTEMVRQFVARLFEDPRVTRVQTDQSPDNPRAIRCYEKAGFFAAGTGHHSQSAGPPHDHRPRVTAVPVQQRPGPPRVVVEGIEGRDTLYEVDLWAAPSPQWRAASLRPPPALHHRGPQARGWSRRNSRGDTALPSRPAVPDCVAATDRSVDRLCQLGGGGMRVPPLRSFGKLERRMARNR